MGVIPCVMSGFLLTNPSPDGPVPGRRRRLDPDPRFLPDTSGQLDPLLGCPALIVPSTDLAWRVREWMEELDTSELESTYSSLGRRGVAPKFMLGALVLGTLNGLTHATEIERACATDARYRLVAGGASPSATRLRTFRRDLGEFLAGALKWTVEKAVKLGLVEPHAIAVDSWRLRADASRDSRETRTKSASRLDALAKVDPSSLEGEARARHEREVARHEAVVRRSKVEGRDSFSSTTPSAGWMKFPDGATGFGHRVNVSATGASKRIVLDVMITPLNNDYGTLEELATGTLETLRAAGLPMDDDGPAITVSADAGYASERDLEFADRSRATIDVLLPKWDSGAPKKKKGGRYFSHEDFQIGESSVTCPDGRAMRGPYRKSRDGRVEWRGVGCGSCPKKTDCTAASKRTISLRPQLIKVRDAMSARMTEPGAKKLLRLRAAIIEPVFSSVQDVMKFRRASSRHEPTIRAEILLRLLAHNLQRLQAAAPIAVWPVVLVTRERRLVGVEICARHDAS